MKGPRTLRRRLMWALACVTASACLLFGVLSFVFVYVVEDEFFAELLAMEAAHIADGGDAPRLPFVVLHHDWADVPLEVRIGGTPTAREVAGAAGRHYHVRRVQRPSGDAWLVAEVGSLLVVRRMRGTLLLVLIPATLIVLVASAVVAALVARRSVRQLTMLVGAVRNDAPPLAYFTEEWADEEIRVLARALGDALQRLHAALRREKAFVGDVSHELRTPLAVITSAAELLEKRSLDQSAASQVQRIRDAARSSHHLTELLLALAREEAEAERRASLPLLPMVEKLVVQHSELLNRCGVNVDVEIDPRVRVLAPPTALEVVLSNVISNALRHGGERIVIEGAADALSVRDDGPGLENASRRGIGLGLVQRLCDECGFRFSVASSSGGTVVTLTFGSSRTAVS